jgi:hypothetical protein
MDAGVNLAIQGMKNDVRDGGRHQDEKPRAQIHETSPSLVALHRSDNGGLA